MSVSSHSQVATASVGQEGAHIRKHDTLYIQDGNVVLSALDASQVHILFRVHRSMLARLSTVFSDMFVLPASSANEIYEGAPLVQMTDSSADLESLLTVIYHGKTLVLKRLSPGIPNMWDALEAEIEKLWYNWDEIESAGPTDTLDEVLPEPVSAINLARECNIPAILPAAFYHLLRLPFYPAREYYLPTPEGEWDGHEWNEYIYGGGRTASWRSLSGGDHYRLNLGRQRIWNATAGFLDTIHSDSDLCSELHGCKCPRSVIQSFTEQVKDKLYRDHFEFDPLKWLGSCDTRGVDAACPRCCLALQKSIAEFRVTLWDKLPECFEIESPL
ncbi:hypothetical protein OE88DRAFT_1811254 [Heliocybe sulcata]|uniref:BTB domain-containing protein n=1 Tax=Heliocybe sulcata TaxID=5364 RepID=A0A5C3MRA3_9AGAM|nr:hypothetical protein OE88DRAFT_1811254 [Heliocybe sulcata]